MHGFNIGGSGDTGFNMEKLTEFIAEEDIEEWVEVFECRAACSKVKDDETKIQWCRSVIGNVGRRILKGCLKGLIGGMPRRNYGNIWGKTTQRQSHGRS